MVTKNCKSPRIITFITKWYFITLHFNDIILHYLVIQGVYCINLNAIFDNLKSFPLISHTPIKSFTVSLLIQLMLSLSWKKFTSTMASTAVFSLEQMYAINLLNLMSPDTEMEGSRIMIFFSRGAPFIGLYFSHNGKYQRSKALTTGRPSCLRLDFPNFCLKS